MKKTILAFFLVLITLSVFAQAGVIRQVSGTVELKHSGAADFVAAEIGDEVRQDTIVSTGFRSTALIEVGNSALITVRALTRLALTEISAAAGTETINANLQAGRIRVDVNPPAGTRASMTVSSPSATASVRGTTIFFDGKNLGVIGGMANFQGQKGPPVLVGDGFSSGISTAGKPSAPMYTFVSGSGDPSAGVGVRPEFPVGSDPSAGTNSTGNYTFVDPGPGPSPDPGPAPGPGPGGYDPWPPTTPEPPTTGDININITY